MPVPETHLARAQAPYTPSAGAEISYQRHRPEETALYRTLQDHWATFVSELESAGEGVVPRFVTEEVAAFLRCGILP